MHVHVHQLGRDLQEQCVGRLLAAVQLVFVGRADRVGDQPVAHETAIDEQVLLVGARACGLGLAGAAVQLQRPGRHGQRAAGGDEVAAQHVGDARGLVGGSPLRHQPAFVPHGKTHVGPRQRVAAHRVECMRQLGGVGLQELAPRRRAEEQLLHFHRGAHGAGRGLQLAAARVQPRGVRGAGGAAGDGQVRDGGDGGQRLAAEAHRRHRLQLGQRHDLAGGVALQRQRQLGGGDAAAVVFHHDAAHAAGGQPQRDVRGAGVECVVDQFAHHRGRAFHHLAGGDLAHQRVGQLADGAAWREHGVHGREL